MKCYSCKDNVICEDLVTCTACKEPFHYWCQGIRESTYRKTGAERQNWKCYHCRGTAKPAKTAEDVLSPSIEEPTNYEILKQIEAMRKEFCGKLEEQSTMFQTLLKENEELKMSVSFLSEKYDKMNSKISEHANLKSEFEEIRQENIKLEKRVHALEEIIDQDRQRQNATKLEIKGVPFQSGENLRSLVSKIGEVTGRKIEDEDIVDVRRFSSLKRDIQSDVDSPSIELTRQGIIIMCHFFFGRTEKYLSETDQKFQLTKKCARQIEYKFFGNGEKDSYIRTGSLNTEDPPYIYGSQKHC
jgi:hypothetical protein